LDKAERGAGGDTAVGKNKEWESDAKDDHVALAADVAVVF